MHAPCLSLPLSFSPVRLSLVSLSPLQSCLSVALCAVWLTPLTWFLTHPPPWFFPLSSLPPSFPHLFPPSLPCFLSCTRSLQLSFVNDRLSRAKDVLSSYRVELRGVLKEVGKGTYAEYDAKGKEHK